MPYKSREKCNEYARELMRKRRLIPEIYQAEKEYAREKRRNGDYRRMGVCEACGYLETVDLHHEGVNREEHILCPNCHALITRGIKTLAELLPPSLHPKVDADGQAIPDY